MLLFSDGVFLSGFCTEVLRGEFYAEGVLHRECYGASALCFQYASSASVRRKRQGSCHTVKKPSSIVSTILYIT